MTTIDTLIIGAGIAGLTAARVLQRHGTLLVLDKSRGVGGRVATRRLGEGHADHGAPCFHLDRADVSEVWAAALAALPRQPAPLALDAEAWICPSGINELAKALATELPLSLNQSVEQLHHAEGLWHCTTREGGVYRARRVLVTSPLPQSAAFFRANAPLLAEEIAQLAREVVYLGQWTLLIAGAAASPFSDYQTLQHPAIASIYEQSRSSPKRGPGIWVVQATSDFSAQQLEADAATAGQLLTQDLIALGWNLQGADIQPHRWRYARVSKPLAQSYVSFPKVPGLYLAGDFCGSSTVMGAAASGLAAALRLKA